MLRPSIRHPSLLLLVGLWACLAALAPESKALGELEDPVVFARDIQPILESRCTKCHGERKQRAGLRLDSWSGALAGSDLGSRAVIVAGDPGASLLLELVSSADEDERMPPSGAPLDAEQIELLARWIAEGASGPATLEAAPPLSDHWAYRAPEPQAVPEVQDSAWVRNEIDAFVLARLEAQGLQPSPEADRATLLRRLSLDLTGLPPTPAELARFEADRSPGAYDREVERLLASPHYGEHQARSWLDLARYADTNGYEKDERRSIWRYRDWVIEAFNADMDFGRFTIEQLAGDLLPGATREQRTATGFHRNTMINAEGGVDPEESRVEAVLDRVNTTASVWMGSTLACAQCHTHKYDPFSHRDYYRLFAYFNSTEDIGPGDAPRLEVPSAEQAHLESEAQAEVLRLEAALANWTPALEAEFEAFEAEQRSVSEDWSLLRPTRFDSEQGTTLALLNEGSVLALGEALPVDTYVFDFDLPVGESLQRLRLEALPHPTLPEGGSALSSHQNFVLSEVELELLPADDGLAPRRLGLASARADYHQTGTPEWPAGDTIDGDRQTGWAIGGAVGQPHALVIALAEPLVLEAGQSLRLRLAQNYGGAHLIGHLRFSGSAAPDRGSSPLPANIARLFEGEAPISESERAGLRSWYLAQAPGLAVERARLAQLRKRPALPTTLVMQEREEARSTHILKRGSFLSPGAEVQPGVPQVLPQPLEGALPNRLGLARWLVREDHPLSARVRVNQLWAQVLGRGLVATAGDFGTQGERPSHPELLDWLALSFQAGGGSTKDFLRRLVSSATYRQSSRVSPALLELDPQNRLLARGARYRVDAEVVRDVALVASGLWSPKIGGPSVFPPQPEGVWNATYSSDRWIDDTDEDRFRRGLYTFWRRTTPYPAFMAFDATSREVSCTQRPASNTPLQALALLNDPAMVEAALALGARMLREGGAEDRSRLEWGWLLCTSQRPSSEDLAVLQELLGAEREHYLARPQAAAQLVHSEVPLWPAGSTDLDPVELAAWTVLGNVLLNLDATITRS